MRGKGSIFVVAVTPTNCRVAAKDFEPRVQKAGFQISPLGFSLQEEPAHR